MALHKTINPLLKSNNDTGFGTSASSVGGRFINKDGSFNVVKEGVTFSNKLSIYHAMLNMPRWKFIALIIIFYFSMNLVFTILYLFFGVNELQGIIAQTQWEKFKEVYFFSTETFTTVGYGRVNPVGEAANIIASLEAVTGFLSFALATGLLYGRFSKPRANLVFSEHAVVAPYQDKTALMFRFASYKQNHNLTDVSVKVTLGMQEMENKKPTYKFYTLALERERADNLPMNFTVVHPIDENSPINHMNFDDMKNADLELYVLVRGFDDVYSNVVLQRTSYVFDEIKFNVKFVPMYRESADKNTTIVELNKLNDYMKVKP